MPISSERAAQLEAICRRSRVELIELLHRKQTGHPGGSLSACEILTVLYQEAANVSPATLASPDRDRIVLTKGHAAPMLYVALAEAGFLPRGELRTLRELDSRLQGHPSSRALPAVELTTGPLGLGLSAALGMALSLRLDGSPARVFAVMGDGELDEGACWEAAMCAAKYGAGSLTAIVDCNGVQLDGPTDEVMPLGDLGRKFEAFGWNVISCGGHDVSALCGAIEAARAVGGRPTAILARTVKGKGVSFMEGKSIWHGRAIDDEHFAQAMRELRGGADT